jgi:hypothetical protein
MLYAAEIDESRELLFFNLVLKSYIMYSIYEYHPKVNDCCNDRPRNAKHYTTSKDHKTNLYCNTYFLRLSETLSMLFI